MPKETPTMVVFSEEEIGRIMSVIRSCSQILGKLNEQEYSLAVAALAYMTTNQVKDYAAFLETGRIFVTDFYEEVSCH